jgi:hypothetical protein
MGMQLSRYLILPALFVASCSGAKIVPAPRPVVQPPVKAVPVTVPATLRQPAGHWTDWPLSAGNWVYRTDDRGSIAYFGETGRNALVTLRCDKGRGRVYLSRAGAALDNKMVIRTSSESKTMAAAATGTTPLYLASDITPTDPILAAISYSRGRIAIETGGDVNIAVPVWAEINRVIEDCRA